METPDNYLVSLEAKTGKERWHKVISDFSQQYFSTMAPIVVGNHVIAGTGNDLDMPGFLQSFDPETGELQWKLYTVPMNPGDPGPRHVAEPRCRAARRRAAVAAGRLRSRDEALHLRHRQPDARLYPGPRRREDGQPVHGIAHRGQRRHRQNGLVLPDRAARHARLGFGADARPRRRDVQGPDAEAGDDRGAQRLFLRARSRDRRAPPDEQVRLGDQLGEEPRREGPAAAQPGEGSDRRRIDRVAERRRHDQLGAARVFAGHRTVLRLARTTSIRSSTCSIPTRAVRWGSAASSKARAGTGGSFLTALDYKTGKAAWRYKYEGGAGGGGGVLATAGKLVFAGDGAGNIVAHDAYTGKALWHSKIGGVTNPPQTYMLDGRQYLLVATNDTLWAFVMY